MRLTTFTHEAPGSLSCFLYNHLLYKEIYYSYVIPNIAKIVYNITEFSEGKFGISPFLMESETNVHIHVIVTLEIFRPFRFISGSLLLYGLINLKQRHGAYD